MPNVAHTYRMTWRGSIGGAQSFSFGFTGRYDGNGPTGDPSSADVVAAFLGSSDLNGFEQDFLAAITQMIGPTVKFSSILYQAWGQNPATPAESQRLINFTGTGATRLPAEVACVVSMRTGLNTRSGRGRTFLPFNALQLDDQNGGFTVAQATAVLTAVHTYLAAIKGHSFIGSSPEQFLFSAIPAVISTTHAVATDITSLRVDTRPDVQRRRQDKIAYSAYQAAL